jgi:hypothetical protein
MIESAGLNPIVDPRPGQLSIPHGQITFRWRTHTHDTIEKVCDEIKDFLIEKNNAYGNSFAEPMNIFSQATAKDQLLARIDDKLSRIKKGHEYGSDDTLKDLVGYLILLMVLDHDIME